MRLSGNYFERLITNVLPLTLFATVVIYFTEKDMEAAIVVFFISTAAFWILDTSIIYVKFKNPKALRFDTSLAWGGRKISPNEIFRITPITDKRYRWSFNMIEFNLNDGTSFIIIDKPKTFVAEILGKSSKTIKRLIEEYPELNEKITGRRFI